MENKLYQIIKELDLKEIQSTLVNLKVKVTEHFDHNNSKDDLNLLKNINTLRHTFNEIDNTMKDGE